MSVVGPASAALLSVAPGSPAAADTSIGQPAAVTVARTDLVKQARPR